MISNTLKWALKEDQVFHFVEATEGVLKVCNG